MNDVLTGPTWASLVLLAVAGAPKVLDPRDTATAVRAALPRLPHPRASVRTLGAVETLIGVAGLLTGHRVLLLAAAVSYVGFTAFVLLARRLSTPLASCGCFGGVDTPPTTLHVVITALLAVELAAAAVLTRPGPWPGTTTTGLVAALSGRTIDAIVALGLAVLICYLLYLVLAVLPSVGVAPRQDSFRLSGGAA